MKPIIEIIEHYREVSFHDKEVVIPSKEFHRLLNNLQWYKTRVQLLSENQKYMRDPERVLVCDILANGQLLPDPDHSRYPYFNSEE